MSAIETNSGGALAGALAGALGAVFLLAATSCSGARQELDLGPVTLTSEPVIQSDAPSQEAIGDSGEAILSSIPEPLPAPQVDAPKNVSSSKLIIIKTGGEVPAIPSEQDHAPRGDTSKTGTSLTLVIIEGGREVPPVTSEQLLAASRRAKERRAKLEPVAVITDKNLKESGIGGQLTFAAVASPLASADTDEPGGDGIRNQLAEEEYWRSGALEVRLSWKAATNEVIELEAEVAQLRRRFYAEDDPHYRDNEIKPAWDRALNRVAAIRLEADDYHRRLTEFLQRGREAGALPGWLREGLEYEPESTDDSPRRREDPNEPEIVDEDSWIDP